MEAQMDHSLPRRSFLLLGSALLTARPGFATTNPTSQDQGARSDRIHATFPTQDPDVVREVVAVAHGNLKRLQELVDRRPTLALATWDWGFGDWETALGAASHVGNREIAESASAKGMVGSALPGGAMSTTIDTSPLAATLKGQLLNPSDAGIDWCRETYSALMPFLARMRNINYLDHDERGEPAADVYGPNYLKLRQLKGKYDPDNFFHTNVNIKPH
jgi:hypothetical protein